MAIVTWDGGAGDGAGAGAGAGDGDGVGDGATEGDGVTEGELGDEYPPPHADTNRVMRAAAVKREKDIERYLLVSRWSGAGIDGAATCNGKRRAMVYPREIGRCVLRASSPCYRARKLLRPPPPEPVPLAA
jgi:hypothetical protein